MEPVKFMARKAEQLMIHRHRPSCSTPLIAGAPANRNSRATSTPSKAPFNQNCRNGIHGSRRGVIAAPVVIAARVASIRVVPRLNAAVKEKKSVDIPDSMKITTKTKKSCFHSMQISKGMRIKRSFREKVIVRIASSTLPVFKKAGNIEA